MDQTITFRFSTKSAEETDLFKHLTSKKGKEPDTNSEGKALMLDGLKYRKLMASGGRPGGAANA